MEIEKGKQYTVGTRFSYRGAPASFINPPKWTIYNSNDQELLSGAAQPSGNVWNAIFTISKNYVVSGGKETLILQFVGHDNKDRSYTVDKELVISDLTEAFQPDGVVYNVVAGTDIHDTIVLPYETAKISIAVASPYETITAATVVPYVSTATKANSSGYVHELTIPAFAVAKNIYVQPHQIMISYGPSSANVLTELEIHPLYLLDMRAMGFLTSIRLYLDKSKLIEIDPSLQWHLTEMLHGILMGYSWINASPPEGTFWNSTNMPSVLDSFLFHAALFYLLNIRYLAEGMNKFEFAGLNTQLTYDRTDPIGFKISEIQGILERLPDAKKSAIAIGGKGTPPPGETDKRLSSVGQLGLSRGLLNNHPNRFPRRFF